MKKVAVVYTSKYGSAEKYAKWICEETDGTAFEASKCKAKDLEEFDTVIYGGGVHAGGIEGIDFLKKNIGKLEGKKILVYAVGLTMQDPDNQAQCIEINLVKKLEGLPCYFFDGAYDPAKVKGIDKQLMKVVHHMAKSKAEDPKTSVLIKAIEEGADFTDRNQIREIVIEALK